MDFIWIEFNKFNLRNPIIELIGAEIDCYVIFLQSKQLNNARPINRAGKG